MGLARFGSLRFGAGCFLGGAAAWTRPRLPGGLQPVVLTGTTAPEIDPQNTVVLAGTTAQEIDPSQTIVKE